MAQLFLLALGLILLLILAQRLKRVEESLLLETLKWTFVGVLVLAGIYLILVGRLLHVAVIGGLVTLLLKTDLRRWLKKRSREALAPPLTQKEARALLGLKAGASPEDIQEAFQKKKAKDSTHQDRLRQARDLLLKKK